MSVAEPSAVGPDDLVGAANQFLDALAARDPAGLRLAETVRSTENGERVPVGRGLWGTVTGRAPGGLHVSDPVSGQVVWFGVVEEIAGPAILALRLRLRDRLITEVEALVGRRILTALGTVYDPARVARQAPTLEQAVDPAERTSREDLARIANLYLDGIERDDGDLIPVADDVARVENGVQCTLAAGSDREHRRLGVAAQINAGYTRQVEVARARRVSAIDEERGLVVIHFVFDHPGNRVNGAGRVPHGYPNSMPVCELFKVRDGRIRQIEAVLDLTTYGAPSGWEQ
jgi:hypothetical protein